MCIHQVPFSLVIVLLVRNLFSKIKAKMGELKGFLVLTKTTLT